MGKTYRCEIDVRGYELDGFGHVNHAIYASYFEHARWKLLEEEQITFETCKAWDALPVIAKLEVTYLKPTFLGDRLMVESTMISANRSSFEVEHRILRKDEVVTTGRVTIVLVNATGRPTRIPEGFAKLLS